MSELDKAGVCDSAFVVDNERKVLRAYCSLEPNENAYPNLDASKLWADSIHYEDNSIYFFNDTYAFSAQSFLRFCIDIEAEVNGEGAQSLQGCSESVMITDRPVESKYTTADSDVCVFMRYNYFPCFQLLYCNFDVVVYSV